MSYARDRLALHRARGLEQYQLPQLPSGNGRAAEPEPHPNFLEEAAELQGDIDRYNYNITRIARIHTQMLDSTWCREPNNELKDVMTKTRELGNAIKEHLHLLNASIPGSGQEGTLRRNRVMLLRKKFSEAVQSYQQMESRFRERNREKVVRQVRIVKPDATDEEIAAMNPDGDIQVFADALKTSMRAQESKLIFRDVLERHQDIQRMSDTMAELGQLFQDLGLLIVQQEDAIVEGERNTQQVVQDLERGNENLDKGIRRARAWRRKKWICFFIFILILGAVAIVLGIVLGTRK